METISFKEDHISQIPALMMLQNWVYPYHSEEALELRGEKHPTFCWNHFT